MSYIFVKKPEEGPCPAGTTATQIELKGGSAEDVCRAHCDIFGCQGYPGLSVDASDRVWFNFKDGGSQQMSNSYVFKKSDGYTCKACKYNPSTNKSECIETTPRLDGRCCENTGGSTPESTCNITYPTVGKSEFDKFYQSDILYDGPTCSSGCDPSSPDPSCSYRMDPECGHKEKMSTLIKIMITFAVIILLVVIGMIIFLYVTGKKKKAKFSFRR